MKRDPGSRVPSGTLQLRMFGHSRRECCFSKSLFPMTRRLFLRTYFPPIPDTALVLTSTNAAQSLRPFCVSLRSCGKPIRRIIPRLAVRDLPADRCPTRHIFDLTRILRRGCRHEAGHGESVFVSVGIRERLIGCAQTSPPPRGHSRTARV
jgi:hypothetical protein